jgi:hypothetical protein
MNRKQGTTSIRRRTIFVRLGLIACAVAVAVAAVAVAADQRASSVLTGVAKDGDGKPLYDLTFKVKNSHQIQKIMAFEHPAGARAASKRCLMPQNFSFKTLDIKSDGTFHGHASGYMFHAKIDGKFKSPSKAHGHLSACTPGLKYTVKK